ncbi:MAG: acylphosphatase [Candidatus Zixiibacteriota bacterium]
MADEELVSAHLLISGLVQGVGYRWFVMRKANEYNLKGYVRNLYTDDVEVEVEGNRGLIQEFIKELRIGPRSAHITDIKIQWGDYQGKYKNFDIKF